MAEQNGAHGFSDAATIAFLARRLHNRRVRSAAVRGLKGVSAESDGSFQADVDLAADCLSGNPSWTPASTDDPSAAPGPDEAERLPRLSIVVMVVGSRGDVQPFIPIGRRLAQRHRVRIATHRGISAHGRGCRARVLPAGRRSARADGVHAQDRRPHPTDQPRSDRGRYAEKARDDGRDPGVDLAGMHGRRSGPAQTRRRSGPTSFWPTRPATATSIAPRRCTSRCT